MINQQLDSTTTDSEDNLNLSSSQTPTKQTQVNDWEEEIEELSQADLDASIIEEIADLNTLLED